MEEQLNIYYLIILSVVEYLEALNIQSREIGMIKIVVIGESLPRE